MHIRGRANVILLYSAVTWGACERSVCLGDSNQTTGAVKRVTPPRGSKWNTNFIFASFIKMITPAFGDNLLHIKFTKVSVNIKVQRICLPVRARLLKVHATSTPNPVSHVKNPVTYLFILSTQTYHTSNWWKEKCYLIGSDKGPWSIMATYCLLCLLTVPVWQFCSVCLELKKNYMSSWTLLALNVFKVCK